jgi:hypothetical protein
MNGSGRVRPRSRSGDPEAKAESSGIAAIVRSARRIVQARENWGCYGMAAPFPATISALIEELEHTLATYDHRMEEQGDDRLE